MQGSIAVRVTSFGDGRYEARLPGAGATVGDVLRLNGIEAQGRRVAVNGHPSGIGSTVVDGDEVTVVPRVQGG